MKKLTLLALVAVASISSGGAFAAQDSILDGMKITFKNQIDFEENTDDFSKTVKADVKNQCGGWFGETCDLGHYYYSCKIEVKAGPRSAPTIKKGRQLELRWQSSLKKWRLNLVEPGTNEVKGEIVCFNHAPYWSVESTKVLDEFSLPRERLEAILGAKIAPLELKAQPIRLQVPEENSAPAESTQAI
jgi:hypothetical protein